jgi:hypothetical protein
LRDRLLVLGCPHMPFGFMPRHGHRAQLATAALVAWTIENIVTLGGGRHG